VRILALSPHFDMLIFKGLFGYWSSCL
jgi:hypothetical protein